MNNEYATINKVVKVATKRNHWDGYGMVDGFELRLSLWAEDRAAFEAADYPTELWDCAKDVTYYPAVDIRIIDDNGANKRIDYVLRNSVDIDGAFDDDWVKRIPRK